MHPYATLNYARTLAHVGTPLWVPAWQSHVIAREWRHGVADATGPYPLACLADAAQLEEGLATLRAEGLVSVVLVADGLAGPALDRFRSAFGYARPFKTHYLVDEAVAPYRPSAHHRYEIRRAAQRGVRVASVPLRGILAEWTALYDTLARRHGMGAAQRFTGESFERLSGCDGLRTVAAYVGDELVACHLWIEHDGRVWSHLAASSDVGYATGAAYAVYDHALRGFAGSLVSLGGSAGADGDAGDGLARFKAGFSNRTLTAHVFGAILDAHAYAALCAEAGAETGDYFPAYRAPAKAGVATTRA